MSFTVLMMNKLDAERYGLYVRLDDGRVVPSHGDDVAKRANRFAVGRDEQGRDYGCWWYLPLMGPAEKWRVIYSGTFDADHPIGDPATTQADLYDDGDPDDVHEYGVKVRQLQGAPTTGNVLKDDGLEGATEKDFEVLEQDTGEEIIPFDLGTKRPLDAGDVETPE